jgi:tRNA (mo5U34)-methyltransferase
MPEVDKRGAPTIAPETLRWFHQMDLGEGRLTPGAVSLDILKAQADIYFRDGLTGLSVLDVGCIDGFNSFEAERRGAGRVLATDHYMWATGSGDRRAFELAHAAYRSSVEVMDIDLPDLVPERIGHFDLVLFCGVLYHMRNPLAVLERLAPVARSMMVVETHMNALDEQRPAMIFYPGTELNSDASNWWGPNRPCIEAMLRDVGFARVDFTPHPVCWDRGIFHAYR